MMQPRMFCALCLLAGSLAASLVLLPMAFC
jgi:hypothetical protein